MAAPKLPHALTERLLREGKGPVEIVAYLAARGIDVTPAAISTFRRRHTDIPAIRDSTKRVPWKVKREHTGSIYRHAILAWHQREEGRELPEERKRNLASIERRLYEQGLVIDYNPRSKKGFVLVPRRPGIDLGIIFEPDGKPHPPTRGPYAKPTLTVGLDGTGTVAEVPRLHDELN